MASGGKISSAFWALRIGLGATAFVAGADKFTNRLTDWSKYMAPEAERTIPMSKKNFMRVTGVIEMLVGVGILSRRTRLSSYIAAAWLLGIAGNLWLNADYDIAARDVNMAIGAFALGQLSTAREQQLPAEKPAHPLDVAA